MSAGSEQDGLRWEVGLEGQICSLFDVHGQLRAYMTLEHDGWHISYEQRATRGMVVLSERYQGDVEEAKAYALALYRMS